MHIFEGTSKLSKFDFLSFYFASFCITVTVKYNEYFASPPPKKKKIYEITIVLLSLEKMQHNCFLFKLTMINHFIAKFFWRFSVHLLTVN